MTDPAPTPAAVLVDLDDTLARARLLVACLTAVDDEATVLVETAHLDEELKEL